MRILVVSNLYPPHAFGGYEAITAGAVEAWREAGHEVDVLTSWWQRDDIADIGDDPRVRRQLPLYWDRFRLVDPPIGTCWEWERRTREVVSQTVDEMRPEVVSVWNHAALPFGVFAYLREYDLPLVLVLGDRWLAWSHRMDGWARRFLGGKVRRGAGRTISRLTGVATVPRGLGPGAVGCFASEHLRRHARDNSPWDLERRALVPHGLALERFPVLPPSGDSGWQGRLLYVGRIGAEKGIETGVRALALLPDAHLDVVGDGDREHQDMLLRLVSDLHLEDRVRFHGAASPEAVREFYLGSDALLFCSEWPEPFGIVPLEAMACGLPVVGTGTGGSGEFLVDGLTAVRFEPGSADGLGRAVERLAGNPELRSRLRENGRDVARWLSRDRTYRDLLRWHRHVGGEDVEPPEDRALLPPSLHERADSLVDDQM